jgi:hypothetical protein
MNLKNGKNSFDIHAVFIDLNLRICLKDFVLPPKFPH